MEDKKESKNVVITQKDQDELVNLLEAYKVAILGHEERIQVLEAAVGAMHVALTSKNASKLIVPRMDIPKEQ